jgi:hypothetical protein
MVNRLNTTALRREWAPPCVGPWATVTLHGGARVTVDPLIVPAVLELSRIFEKWGYRATPPDTGAMNCRRITGGSGYSLHAYGIAVDINWLDNPYGPRLVTDMPAGMVAEIEALRTRDGWQVWGWGGRYSKNKDAMHYEIVCAPRNLATGIAGTQPQEERLMVTPDDEKVIRRIVDQAIDAKLEAFGSALIATLTGSAGVKPGTVAKGPGNPVYDLRTVAHDVAKKKDPYQ